MNESFSEIKNFLSYHNVTLVAIGKTKTQDEILEVYREGQRIFGENKVQELLSKYEALPKDITWHLVGHLQTNKVKYLVPFISLIHSVDSWKLLEEIEIQARKHERVIDVLLQVHIAEEETKFGLNIEQARKFLADDDLEKFEMVRIRGLMGMATLTGNTEQIKKEFQTLKVFFDEVRLKLMNVSAMSDITFTRALNNNDFTILSMGMSSDYKIAVEQGSNMVRIGSAIFGERNSLQ